MFVVEEDEIKERAIIVWWMRRSVWYVVMGNDSRNEAFRSITSNDGILKMYVSATNTLELNLSLTRR
jgi:hypothetical protein